MALANNYDPARNRRRSLPRLDGTAHDGLHRPWNCVAHSTAGAMGYHYFNKALIDDLAVDPLNPEGLVYAPGPNGQLQLAAVEYVVPGLASNPPGVFEPPTLFGSKMVILVPAVGFHTLHAWVWRSNPAGMFAHWNPDVVCP